MTDEAQLHRLVEQTERMQERTLQQTREAIEFVSQPSTARSRRSFLKMLGVGGIAATGSAALIMPSLAVGAPTKKDGDTVNFAIRVELFAVGAYMAAGAAASQLGLSDGEVAVATLFASHHQAHADAESAFLKSLGIEPATKPLATDKELGMLGLSTAAVGEALKTKAGILTAALYVEELAAKTYSDFAASTKDRGVSDFAWSIAPVELGHGAYLRALLGKGPQEASFAGAITPISLG